MDALIKRVSTAVVKLEASETYRGVVFFSAPGRRYMCITKPTFRFRFLPSFPVRTLAGVRLMRQKWPEISLLLSLWFFSRLSDVVCSVLGSIAVCVIK